MANKTMQDYEDFFGELISILTGLDEDKNVFPMKQANGVRLKGLKPDDDWCSFHPEFDQNHEEPYTQPTQDKVNVKRFIRVEYNFYGPNAANLALQFKSLHFTALVQEKLYLENMSKHQIYQNVIDLDEVSNGNWYTRRKLVIEYLEEIEIEFPAGVVEEVVETEETITVLNEN